MSEAEQKPRVEHLTISSHGEWDTNPAWVRGFNERGEPVAEIVGVPAMTGGNIALWTGRREWAIRVQLDAIARRRARGKRTHRLLARLLRPVRGHRFAESWPVTTLAYARVESITFNVSE